MKTQTRKPKGAKPRADVARARLRAQALRAELDLRDPTEVPIDDVAMERGAVVLVGGVHGAEGRLEIRPGHDSFISVSTRVGYAGHRRFVVAHELGHLELHADRQRPQIWDDPTVGGDAEQGWEKEANAFAAELLMPEELWKRRTGSAGPGMGLVQQLADAFQVSFKAALWRFVELSGERCCLVKSALGRVAWCVPSRSFGFFIKTGRPLSPGSHALSLTDSVTQAGGTLPAHTWIDSSRLGANGPLHEDSRCFPHLGYVLSLLWIPPDAGY